MGYLHRDDVPYEVAEEITKKLKEEHPDKKIIFAGDLGADLPEAVVVAIKRKEAEMRTSLMLGCCLECDDYMPGYIKAIEEQDADYMIPDGWAMYTNPGTKTPGHYMCPECEKKSGGEMIHKIEVKIKDKNDE